MIPALALLAGVTQLAPALSKIFGAGEQTQEVADTVAKIAQSVTGTSTNDSALEALKADPAKLVELQLALLAQEKELEALYVGDKNSARDRDVQFIKAGTRNYRADGLVAIGILVILVILYVVIKMPEIGEYAKGVITTILGVFLNQLTNIYSFEFGTTRKKEEQNSQITSEYIKS